MAKQKTRKVQEVGSKTKRKGRNWPFTVTVNGSSNPTICTISVSQPGLWTILQKAP